MSDEESVKSIAAHMRALGLGALAHANWHANFASWDNAYWPELSVVQAAHAAELLIKARIAEEHHLLIFDKLPGPGEEAMLDRSLLAQAGRTVGYNELPNRLWAAAGISVPAINCYKDFGKLRDAIQHFLPPTDKDFSTEAVNFIYTVIDPFINECWGLFAVDFHEDTEPYVYLVEALLNRDVLFLVSPRAASDLADNSLFEMPQGSDEYSVEMRRRLQAVM